MTKILEVFINILYILQKMFQILTRNLGKIFEKIFDKIS